MQRNFDGPDSSIAAGQSQKNTVWLFIEHRDAHVPENIHTGEVRFNDKVRTRTQTHRQTRLASSLGPF